MIRVKATQLGFFAGRRLYRGQEFVIDSEAQYSENWMEKLDAPAQKKSEEDGGKSAQKATKSAAKSKGKAKGKGKSKGKGKKVI